MARLSPREQQHHRHVPAIDLDRARIVTVPLWLPGIGASTLGRVIVVRHDRAGDRALLAHELVHVRQWRELGMIRFLRSYLGEYVALRRSGLPHRDAYRGISFEVEARRSAGMQALAETSASE